MVSVRAPKWDWQPHLAKMRELYDLRMSIPEIHEAIQCESFKPCLSSVYSKFRSLGYPTDLVERTKLLDTMSPRSSDSQASEIMQGVEFNDLADNRIPYDYEKRLSPGPKYLISQQPTKPWKHESQTSSRILGHGFQCVELGGAKGEDICQKNPTHSAGFRPPLPDVHPGTPWHPPNNSSICEDWDFDQAFEFRNWPVKLTGTAYVDQNSTHFNPEDIHFGNLQDFGLDVEVQLDARPYSQPQDQNQTSNFLNNPMNQLFQPKDGSNHRLENIVSSSAHSSKSIKKIRSWFRPKSGDSSRASSKYADSHLTTETGDSGYFSGYASRISLEDIHNINPKSLEEFNGLYRVACSTLHEPHSKSQWKDIPTCSYCSYSSIHNLAWSARYLKLEVFSLELQLKDVYDVCALDAAGNTALHYAAASGAGLKHMKALIDAGVNPYIANTAGELFVYCLRPLQPFTLEPNSDCFDGDDLIHLLELLQPQLAFDWRNNSGQTILHALALKMTDPGLRDAVFKVFHDAGYPATILDRFGRRAGDVVPLTYGCHGQVINPVVCTRFLDVTHSPEEAVAHKAYNELSTEEKPAHHITQIKAHTIIAKAHQQARYVDLETGDNVIHALSRLRSAHDILENLECFNQKDIDLNLHNREGRPPLVSLICNRSCDEYETGATMSKYLDAILWKTTKERICNNINVNMKDREGATALHCAAVRGRPDSTRSLIEAGANVNARLDNGLSILHATFDALHTARMRRDDVQVHLFKEVISHLEHAGAVLDPTSLQERGI